MAICGIFWEKEVVASRLNDWILKKSASTLNTGDVSLKSEKRFCLNKKQVKKG